MFENFFMESHSMGEPLDNNANIPYRLKQSKQKAMRLHGAILKSYIQMSQI